MKIFVLRMPRMLRHDRLYFQYLPKDVQFLGWDFDLDNLIEFRIFVLPKTSHVLVLKKGTCHFSGGLSPSGKSLVEKS